MPVRDLDSFFPPTPRPLRFLANRGANGIDGVVSSALGVAAAGPRSYAASGPLVLVIGDLSLYHDANGLLASKLHDLDATIILLNNDGGGIFSFLPQAGLPAFEPLFGTPHGLDFRPLVEMYGGRFHAMRDWTDFRGAVATALNTSGLNVIEVRTERRRNVALHRTAWERVEQALRRPAVAAP
jgi:2-succinyl-5-enolpyruvyl-6-hydroxy-3-cyclohexene-1-carboxylate synthase